MNVPLCNPYLAGTMPWHRSLRYVYNGEGLPKDDPNSAAPLLASVYDEVSGTQVASSRVEYRLSARGDLLSAQYNQTYTGTTLTSYCQTDYAYRPESAYYPASTNNRTRMWLSQIKHTLFTTAASSSGMTSRVLLQNDYSNYDAVGNRKSNHLYSNDPASQTDRTEQYTYDNLYRLKTANYGDGLSQTYTFDPMGNRTKLDETANNTTTSVSYDVDATNRLTSKYPTGSAHSTPNVVSDPNGNVLTDGARANTWDSENRLVSCVKGTQTSAFTYGADGLRRTMSVSDSATPANNLSKTFLLDNGMPVAERQKTGAAATTAPSPTDPLSVTYLQGARGPECVRDETSGTVRWYMTDGLGSVLGEVLPSGAVDGKRKLDVYGVDRGKTGTLKSNQGFVGNLGHQTDDSTGLVYMRARYYDPNTGRFVSQDPALNGQNWFCYCGNDPVNKVDPAGHQPRYTDYGFWVIGIGLAVGAFEALSMGELGLAVNLIAWSIFACSIALVSANLGREEGRLFTIIGMALTGPGGTWFKGWLDSVTLAAEKGNALPVKAALSAAFAYSCAVIAAIVTTNEPGFEPGW